MMPIAHETHFAPRTRIERRRLLPVPGTVRVHVGDRVQPRDIVAEAQVAGPLCVLDVARELGISARAADRAIRVAPNEQVALDALLASSRLGRRQLRAPFAGTVQGIEDGCILLRGEPELLTVSAYIPGQVVEIYPHRGVAIRTYGALVRGIWGAGEETEGPLVVMTEQPDQPLTWEKVGLRYRGTILVGGMIEDPRVLYRASQFRLHGLVVGSILPSLRPICERLALPLLITEGMGRIPMAAPLFELLHSCYGRPAVLSGSPNNGSDGPEVIVPLVQADEAMPAVASRVLEVGARVRLTRPPYLGWVGHIVTLPDLPQETAIGTQAEGAEVRLFDGRKLFVPFGNLELLE